MRVRKLFSSIPGLRTMVNHPQANVLSDEERYDPRKRDPQYAHAETSPLWELVRSFCRAFFYDCMLTVDIL